MTKRKKSQAKRQSPRPAPAGLNKRIQAAMTLLHDGEALAAGRQLLALAGQYPRNSRLLRAILEVSLETGDLHTTAYALEELAALETGPDRPALLNNLVGVLLRLSYSVVGLHYAEEIAAQYPESRYAGAARQMVEQSRPRLIETAIAFAGTADPDEALALFLLHDRLRFYTEADRPEKAGPVAEALLQRLPDHIPTLNNLSQVQFSRGDIQAAVATAGKVLALVPDNFHALSNLVRYHVLTAEFDQAEELAGRLRQITGDMPDLPMKQAEAFAFLGDDQAVLAAYERAKAQKWEPSATLLHLAATASYRLGKERAAWKLWQAAADLDTPLNLAEACLDQQSLGIGERDIPWYWPLDQWFPGKLGEVVVDYWGAALKSGNQKAFERGGRLLLADRPYLPRLFPHILELGNRPAREFILGFIELIDTPELARIALDFARSPHGADDLRMEALQYIGQEHLDLLPEDKTVMMWLNGQQSEVSFLGFHIYHEPVVPDDMPAEALERHSEIHDLLIDGRFDEAEPLLEAFISEFPDFPPVRNHLAVVYENQGRQQEMHQLVEETHARFPDYLFGRTALARILTGEKRYAEARELLAPLLRLPSLHITEFRALATCSMGLDLAEGRSESAGRWLAMLREIDGDSPDLDYWDMRIAGPGRLLEQLMRRMPSKPKRRGR